MGTDYNMRAYFWGNMYLSSIQQGIQAAHVVGDMFCKYTDNEFGAERALYDWAENHKTMILFNGGYQSKLTVIEDALKANKKHAWAAFREEEDSLNGALTSVGVILPEYVYTLATQVRNERAPAIRLVCGINDDTYIYINDVGNMVEVEVDQHDLTLANLVANSNLAS